jgi:hypothetical protein
MSPDGTKVIATTTLPGDNWVAPDQVEEAEKVMAWKQKNYTTLLTKIHPDWTKEQVQQSVLQLIAGESGIPWTTQAEQLEQMNTAITTLLHNHTHLATVGGNKVQQLDELGQFISSYFVTDADGRYAWNPALRGDQSKSGVLGLYGDPTYGGHTEAEVRSKMGPALAELRTIVRAQIRKQYPKWTESQVDQKTEELMPKMSQQQQQTGTAGGMTPATPQNLDTGQAQGDEGPQMWFSVLTPEGRQSMKMSRKRADILSSKGVDISLLGGSTP